MQNERMDWAAVEPLEENVQPLHGWEETEDAGQDGPEHRTLRQRMDWAALEEEQRLE